MEFTNEYERIYTCEPTFSMFNQYGYLKPYGYQSMMNIVAEEHLNNIHCSMDDLSKYDMAWVLLSASFEIAAPVDSIMKLKAHTWHSKQNCFTFRRDFSFCNENGELLFNAATFSVLFDINNRRILKPSELPVTLPAANNNLTIQAVHHFKNKSEMTVCDHRRIYSSCIDRLGHTNNERYGEFAYDALTTEETARLDKLRRFELYYINELCLGKGFDVRRGVDENGCLIIDGIEDNAKKESFSCRMEFDI